MYIMYIIEYISVVSVMQCILYCLTLSRWMVPFLPLYTESVPGVETSINSNSASSVPGYHQDIH